MNILELHRKFRRYCRVEEGLSPETIKGLKSSMSMFMRLSGARELKDVTLSVVKDFFYAGSEEHEWSYSTYVNHHKYLKKFFNWCIENGYMKKNYVLEVKKPKKPKSLPRRLTEEEGTKVVHETFMYPWRYEFEAARNYSMIFTMLFTGLRSKELLGLKVADVDLDGEKIFVANGKGDKDRYVPMHFKLKRTLKKYLADRKDFGKNSPYLFPSVRGDLKLSYKNWNTICRKVSKSSGIRFTAHCLRHTFGSVAIEQGIGLVQLKEIMGHNDVTSTMIYLKMSTKGLQESLGRLELF